MSLEIWSWQNTHHTISIQSLICYSHRRTQGEAMGTMPPLEKGKLWFSERLGSSNPPPPSPWMSKRWILFLIYIVNSKFTSIVFPMEFFFALIVVIPSKCGDKRLVIIFIFCLLSFTSAYTVLWQEKKKFKKYKNCIFLACKITKLGCQHAPVFINQLSIVKLSNWKKSYNWKKSHLEILLGKV